MRYERGNQITLFTHSVKFGNSYERLPAMDNELDASEGAVSVVVDAQVLDHFNLLQK